MNIVLVKRSIFKRRGNVIPLGLSSTEGNGVQLALAPAALRTALSCDETESSKSTHNNELINKLEADVAEVTKMDMDLLTKDKAESNSSAGPT
jgi:hypothetical protein